MTDAIMFGIGHHLETHPELAPKVQAVFQWKLSNPDSEWVLDAKNGKGSVTRGTVEKPDATLTMSDEDFLGMANGTADAQKLYFGGKLKIGGNVMASQKLDFLKTIDRDAAAKAYAAKGGAAPSAAAPAASAPAKAAGGDSPVDAIMFGIGYHLETNPDLASKVQAVFQWKLTSPDSEWVLDAKNGKGSVARGTIEKPDATLSMSTEDFIGMASGTADAQKLYFGGKLKIGGNVMASQKLDFLKKIDRDAATKAYAARGASALTASSSTSGGGAGASKQPRSPAIFAALKDRLAKSPAELTGAIQFEVKSPDKSFVVDAKSASEGTAKDAKTTIRIEEDDLVALVKGQATASDLFMRGRLRVDGDVAPAHKLAFLQNLL